MEPTLCVPVYAGNPGTGLRFCNHVMSAITGARGALNLRESEGNEEGKARRERRRRGRDSVEDGEVVCA